jgi:phosphopantothenoylcysteine decarboxylase/phosphopantothenate--cysteine ligase
MWKSPSTAANIKSLNARGVHIVGPAEGEQACGDVGPGRMEEPRVIAEAACGLFEGGLLAGMRVVITAGPTRESIDPVRYISNHSSGKMGYALARAAVDEGALTTLVSGPVHLEKPEHANVIPVQSAGEMLEACRKLLPDCDIFIACAAVADYTPAAVAGQKIKKTSENLQLDLVRTPDIVATVSAADPRPFTVGFAAETRDVVAYARDKMERKGLDMIIANDVSNPDIGFNSDDNAVTVIWHGGEQALERASKGQIARQIMALVAEKVPARGQV